MSDRKVEGTNKFIIYFYNGKMVRGGEVKANHFVYKQMGRIFKIDSNNNAIGDGYAFTNYGEMITLINKIMRKDVMKNLKSHGTWR